jgi:hypothetical protein
MRGGDVSYRLLTLLVCLSLSGCLANTIGYPNATGSNVSQIQFIDIPQAQYTLVNVYTDAERCTGVRHLPWNNHLITVRAGEPVAFTLSYVLKLSTAGSQQCVKTLTFTPQDKRYRVVGAVNGEVCGFQVQQYQRSQWIPVKDVTERATLTPFLDSQPRCPAPAR